jgi:tetratricopeptide (TPR) repeat protein
MNKDSTYNYGFIYIDSKAGLTLNLEGHFKISSTGQYLPERIDTAIIKVRLEPNNVLVSFIPESKYEELKIKAIPDWLKYYKTDTASVERLYRWGFMYNGWNECAKALTFLEKAQKTNPKFEGLSVELAYSYNCLKQYDKAIQVLQDALKTSPTDAYVNKELIYAQIKSGQLEAASESCERAIKVCDDKTYNGENCYNLLYEYYIRKDKANFNLWLKETKKWAANNADITRNIKVMESELKK